MQRRTILAGLAASAVAPGVSLGQGARTKVVFWHAMNGVLGEVVNGICAGFNGQQTAFEVLPVFKGTYPETLTAAIAAWRAGQAPHLVQMFEVGTGSMLAAGPAVKQTWEVIQESGVAIDPAAYVGAVKGYYSLPDGRLASMPFNSSTPVMWFNKDAFEKAGLNPDAPPATWPEVVTALRAIKDKGASSTVMTSAWFSWVQFECFGAIHDLPFSTMANGFEGLGTELRVNSPAYVAQLQRFLDLSKEGLFKYAGRDGAADPLFYSGEAAVSFMSSGSRGDVAKSAKFRWGEAALPYDPALTSDPLNSVIGGASLWTMTAPGRSSEEYKGVATFLKYIAEPAADAAWHQKTGYVPVTTAGYELSKSQGYYDRNPGADVPIRQLARGHVTANSRGFRLGRMPEIRSIIYEETEKALQGQQTAQVALDSVVARGNKVLRDFERANKA